MASLREVVVLGSTGSIGTQAIDVVRRDPDRFRVVGLAAGGAMWICWPRRPSSCGSRSSRLRGRALPRTSAGVLCRGAAPRLPRGRLPVPKLLAGPDARRRSWRRGRATSSSTASPARSAWRPPWPRSTAGRPAGAGQQGVADRRRSAGEGARGGPGQIVPVDSEHSALAQCLRGGARDEVGGWC